MLQSTFYRTVVVFALTLSFTSLQAQETAPSERSLVRVGVWGHATWQQHTAQFLGLANATYPQAPYSDSLSPMRLSANPIQWSAGALGEIPIWEGNGTSLGIAARLGVQALGATFSSSLPNVPIAGVSAPGILDFTLQTNALFLSAEPLVQWRFGQNRFAFMAGMSFGAVFRETTSQSRILRSPARTEDPDVEGSEAGTLGSGTFGRPIISSVVAGISWEVPITADGALLLVPEVLYSYGLSSLTTNLLAQENQSAFWRMSSIRAGLALKFAPEKPPIPPPPPPEITPVQAHTSLVTLPSKAVAAPFLAKTASVEGVEPDAKGDVALTLKVEEFLASSSRFLLPYIFFHEQSAALPERYKPVFPKERSAFTPEKLINSTFDKDHELDAYYHLLNIVGYRMRQYPAARLTLTGYTDVIAESADKTLGLRRAEAVKNYLLLVWEIAGSRIVTKSGGARGLAETIDAEENRIVEMQATMPEIFDELRYNYILRTVQPPTLDIEPKITAPKGLSGWSVRVEQDAVSDSTPKGAVSKQYGAFEGTIAPNIVTWGAQRTFTNVAPFSTPLRITLQARDKAGESAQDRVSLPVEVLTVAEKQRRNSPDVRVGTYWVFCFNLNSKQVLVDERVRRAVQGITSYITPDASVEIMGYSDTRGNVAKNRKLSDDRAEAVLQVLRVPSSKIANVSGKGESTFYDNDLPEGRFYNRFVRVDVRTPMEQKR